MIKDADDDNGDDKIDDEDGDNEDDDDDLSGGGDEADCVEVRSSSWYQGSLSVTCSDFLLNFFYFILNLVIFSMIPRQSIRHHQ